MGPDSVDGIRLFVRYAYPPNSRGYCGPDDARTLRTFSHRNGPDAAFTSYAQSFTGAWPYLEVIAGASGIDDPLDPRVVEAYWIGNDLLEHVDRIAVSRSMIDRFRRSVGGQVSDVSDAVVTDGLPHHSFHVFCVYPWAGLLRHERMRPHALHVLDKCRIRAARVLSVAGDSVTVESVPLAFDGERLALGTATVQATIGTVDAHQDLDPGDVVSVHWDWLCDRLTDAQTAALQRQTARHLDLANERLSSPV